MTEPRYRLDTRIATGGMGEVWRATDTVLGREVALKILKHEYADDPTFRSRFEGEARHAAALTHPHIASVFDFGELPPDDGSGSPRPYLVMELVPGEPLSDLLRKGEPMPPETAADLVGQAADAVAAAHALGIVHRDIKPGNLLVTPEGRVKMTDFGIARAADSAQLTQTGQVLGTPAYLSPEQAEGKPATMASDIYALGVVLYECLAGNRPFGGDTPIATALAHLRDDPPPLPESVPEHLRRVVTTALAKDPAARFGSAGELARTLRGAPVPEATSVLPAAAGAVGANTDRSHATQVLTAPPPAADPSGGPGTGPDRRRRRGLPPWGPWVGAAIAVLAVVLLIGWLGSGDEPARTSDAGPSEAPATSEQAQSQQPEKSAQPKDQSTEEDSGTVTVDREDYVGLPKDEAKGRLEELGLKTKDQKVENPEGYEQDTVADLEPTGEVEPGTEITLYLWDKPLAEKAPPGPGKGKGHDKPKGKDKDET